MRKFIFLLVILGGLLLTLSITGKDSTNPIKNDSLPQAAAAVKKEASEKE